MNIYGPTFSQGDHPQLVCSLLRSAGGEVHVAQWSTDSVMLPLWWGGHAWVGRGCEVTYILTPDGMMFESVIPGPCHADG
jgi:hypothetical protein